MADRETPEPIEPKRFPVRPADKMLRRPSDKMRRHPDDKSLPAPAGQ